MSSQNIGTMLTISTLGTLLPQGVSYSLPLASFGYIIDTDIKETKYTDIAGSLLIEQYKRTFING